jgi:hypothetical protein
MSCRDAKRYRPAAAGMHLLSAVRRRWPDKLAEGAREEWLAKLMGGTSCDPSQWKSQLAAYSKKRVNLY